MPGIALRGEIARHAGHRRRPRLLAAHVERAGLVVAAPPGQERVPIVAAEQSPGRHRAHVRPAGAQPQGGVPDLLEPAQLLLARAAEVHLGRGQRQAVSAPRLQSQALEAGGAIRQDPHRIKVRVAVAPVAGVRPRRIALDAVVEEAFARRIVVEPDDVRRARVRCQLLELGAEARTREVRPERMPWRHAPGQEVERQPAARVLVARLIGERGRAVRLGEVLGLNQARGRIDLPDGAHREPDRGDLVEEDAREYLVARARGDATGHRGRRSGRWSVAR